MGYNDVKRVGKTADRGVDVEAYHMDEFGHRTKYIVQCKFYDKTPVSSPDLQQFAGAIATHNAGRGIFITSSHFTKEAEEIARLNSITLIDGVKFAELCESYNVKSVLKTRKRAKVHKSMTHRDLYNNLSFGSTRGETPELIIPNLTPSSFIQGFSENLIYNYDIKLEDLEITDAYIEIKGFFIVNWNVNKVWHDSQGKQKDSWRGKGTLVTNEKGDVVYDVGDGRRSIKRSKIVKFFDEGPPKNQKEILKKFKINYPKVKRVAYKQLIKIKKIPSGDIFCKVRKSYVSSKMILEYRYKGKECSFIVGCIDGKITDNKPIFNKHDARSIAVQEHPELETSNIKIKQDGLVWTVNAEKPLKTSFNIHINSGNILKGKTNAEVILEEATKKAKKIFRDVKYAENIIFNINIGKTSESYWTLDFTSKNGQIFVRSSIDGTLTLTPRINETYALELALTENKNDSELVNMTKDTNGYLFHFKDPQCDWKLHVDYQARKKITSKMLTHVEAVNRSINYLISKDVDTPTLISKQDDTTRDLYKLKFRSDVDGEYEMEVYQSPSKYSCEIVKMKITQNRAQYLAKQISKGEIFSAKRRYWGFGTGWDAIITDEKGQQKKIQIKPNGEIIE